MEPLFTLNKSINILARLSQVWDALTRPELIKEYFFGTECITDWKKGSQIIFKGVWDGKPYTDKGNILAIKEREFILYNYWSSFSGTEDIPENYSVIRYELESGENSTKVTVMQEGFKTEESLEHSEKNWGFVLEGLKKLLEKSGM